MKNLNSCIICQEPFFFASNIFICRHCELFEDQKHKNQKQVERRNQKWVESRNQKFVDHKSQKPDNKKYCPICTYGNTQNAVQCICEYVFSERHIQYSVPPEIIKCSSLLNCPKCLFQNHLQNQYCLNCEAQLFDRIKKTCQICSFRVNQENYEKHYEECLMSKRLIQQEQIIESRIKPAYFIQKPKYMQRPPQAIRPIKPSKHSIRKLFQGPALKIYQKTGFLPGISGIVAIPRVGGNDKTLCYYCNQHISKSQMQFHAQICQQRLQWVRNMEASYARMTPLQTKAIIYMQEKSAMQHQKVRQQLQKRIIKLGHSVQDLKNLQFYIEKYAPIIIQVHVSKHMQFFVKDSHYRNQFQTNQSSGSLSRSSRTQWQNRMFYDQYNLASDFQRVKYGVINFTNDPKGVQCAKSYGASYFLLKSHVRDRCTFTDKDSSSTDASIATLKFSFQVVNKINDVQLKAAFKASKALQESSGVVVTYKQLQIHGPIQFSKDIERIYVSKQQIKGHKNLLDLVYEFSLRFKVEHDFI